MNAEGTEKLAGHAPATIVGGMRVGGANHSKNNTHKEVETKENIENVVTENTLKDGTLVNAQPMKLKDAFPTEAVKKFHEKQYPTHEKTIKHQQNNVFQPQNKAFHPHQSCSKPTLK